MMLNSWNCFQFSSGFVNGKTLGWKLKYLGTVLETAKEKSFFLPENRHQVKFSLKSHIILDEKDLLWCKSKEGEKIAFVASNIYLTFISLLFFFFFLLHFPPLAARKTADTKQETLGRNQESPVPTVMG